MKRTEYIKLVLPMICLQEHIPLLGGLPAGRQGLGVGFMKNYKYFKSQLICIGSIINLKCIIDLTQTINYEMF
jgi:hypothetical protein